MSSELERERTAFREKVAPGRGGSGVDGGGLLSGAHSYW